MSAALELLLADGRFPGGGFAHSGGLEPAVADGSVHDLATLRAFLEGRLHSGGPLDAWLAASACAACAAGPVSLAAIEAEAEAHQPSPALRAAARAQGRGLRRSAAVLWPAAAELDCEVQPVVLGAVAALAGLAPLAAARLATYGLAMTVAGAAAKLAAIDMADALGTVASLAAEIDTVAAAAAALAAGGGTVRPRSAPWHERRADHHRAWEVRLFAS